MQKSTAFLYANNESERESKKKKNLNHIKNKIFRNKEKNRQDLYLENYKTQTKENTVT